MEVGKAAETQYFKNSYVLIFRRIIPKHHHCFYIGIAYEQEILIPFLKLSCWYKNWTCVSSSDKLWNIKCMNAQYAENGHFSNRKMDSLYSHLALGWSRFYPLNSLKLLTAWPRKWRAKGFKARELGHTNRNLKENISNIITLWV